MGYILEKKLLAEVSNSLRDRGDTVVFTHGAFDLFHVGHFELLKRSKKIGDILIVGIDSDERISRYKNNYRPIIPFKERMQIVSAISFVDFIMPLDWSFTGNEAEFIQLYKALNPNIVTFGKKWAGLKHIEKDRKLLKNTKFKQIIHSYSTIDFTTTKIIRQIQDRGDLLIQ